MSPCQFKGSIPIGSSVAEGSKVTPLPSGYESYIYKPIRLTGCIWPEIGQKLIILLC